MVDGLYQVRNNDTGNLTIIDGPTGLVIIIATYGALIHLRH